MSDAYVRVYKAWDLPTRLFHWINFLCVITLSFLGLVMMNKSAIGISGTEANIGLKTVHVLVGYIFAANLLLRIVWGFLGNRQARWNSILPGKNFKQRLREYKASVKSGQPKTYVGHTPDGRLSVMFMLLLLTTMMVTGIIRAGTDIYYPPLGGIFASQVAAEGVSPSTIKPYDKTGTDADKLAKLQAFKGPVGDVHIYTAYVLWFMLLLHIAAVIRLDSKGEGTLISAMFSGKKHLPREPEDL